MKESGTLQDPQQAYYKDVEVGGGGEKKTTNTGNIQERQEKTKRIATKRQP